MAQDEKKEFTFINEQIKKKPLYRRRWFTQGISCIVLALVFGASAGMAFAIVRPWAEVQFGRPDDPTQIVVVQEESEEKQPFSERAEEQQSSDGNETSGKEHASDGNEQTESISDIDETAEKESSPKETGNTEERAPLTEGENGNLMQQDVYAYKKMYAQMKKIAEKASASMVKVNSYTTETDWFNEVREKMSEASGLVLRIDSNRVYVLTSSQIVQNAQQIVVTFQNEETAEAAVRKKDTVTELAVLEIPIKNIKKSTRKSLAAVSIKGVSGVETGDPVIAVGSPLGYTDSLAFGMVTSVAAYQSVDDEYRIISTDIIGNEKSHGILVNLDGDIVGIISKKFDQKTAQNAVSAIRIADLNYLLELLMADQNITYMGITGKEVDAEAVRRFDMPGGIYVNYVAADSPAMYAGIQTADVISEIDGQRISNVKEYAEILKLHKQNDILNVTVKRKSIEGYVTMELRVIVGAR